MSGHLQQRLNVSRVIPKHKGPHKKSRTPKRFLSIEFQEEAAHSETAELRLTQTLVSDALFQNDSDAAAQALDRIKSYFKFNDYSYKVNRYGDMASGYFEALKTLCRENNENWRSREAAAQPGNWYLKSLRSPLVLTDQMLTLLFCLYRGGSLDTARELVDFMDERNRLRPRPIKIDRVLARGHDLPGVMRRYESNHTRPWPYDWAPRAEAPALLKHMIEKKSCLLPHALQHLPDFVHGLFTCNESWHMSERKDGPINISTFAAISQEKSLITLPGALRGLVLDLSRARHRYAASGTAALQELDKIMHDQFDDIREKRKDLRTKKISLTAIWTPPCP